MKDHPLENVSFHPVYDRVVIIPEEREQESASGFKLADNSTGEDIVQRGEVIEVGAGRYGEHGELIPMPVKKGDVVLFGYHSGDDILVSSDGKIQRYKGKIVTGTTLVKIVRADAILTRISFSK